MTAIPALTTTTTMKTKFNSMGVLLKIESATPLIVSIGADADRASSAGFLIMLALSILLTLLEVSFKGWRLALIAAFTTVLAIGVELFILRTSNQLHGPIAIYGAFSTLLVIGTTFSGLGLLCCFVGRNGNGAVVEKPV